ncbi:MAG TPA: hypothetical protein EYP71_07265 [Dehalococcoidia bacterium]|nr:hypothetical protein [Dehalococcoidia bacterium]
MPAKCRYTDNLKDFLRLEPSIKSDIIREIDAHLKDKSRELVESGLSEEEATATAIKLLGPPRLVARQMYEVYSQGSWFQALFAALPHLLVAALFALHIWQNTLWLLGLLGIVIATVIYGWCHGKPAWLFPWLGYCLIPVIAVGTLLIYLPGGWAWFAVTAYVPLALLVILSVTKRTIEKDWLFASLMLLPIPIVLGWMLALGIGNRLPWYEHLHDVAHLVAFSFAALAFTVATFVRVRQRWAKVGALLTFELLVIVIVTLGNRSGVGTGGWLLLALLGFLLLIGPALIDRKLRKIEHKSLTPSNKPTP